MRHALLAACALIAAGCAAPASDPLQLPPDVVSGLLGDVNGFPAELGSTKRMDDGRIAYHLTQWPASAQLVEVRFAAGHDADVHVEGSFRATWPGSPGTEGLPEATSNGDRPMVELFDVILYEEGIPAQAAPVADVAVWRSFGMVPMGGQSFDLRAEPIGAPAGALEVTFGGWGAYGDVHVSYTEGGFTAALTAGRVWGLVLAATNLNGAREMPQVDLTFTADAGVVLGVRAATDPVAAWSNGPMVGGGQGASLGLARPPLRAGIEHVEDASLPITASGRLLFSFIPWAMATNASARYTVEAPDLSFDAEQSLDEAGMSFRCTRGCDDLGGTYAVNSGFGPAGDYRFTVPQATCVVLEVADCLGGFIALDLGRAQALLPAAP